MSEREIRAFESDVIGPAHAAEHAAVRRREGGVKPAPGELGEVDSFTLPRQVLGLGSSPFTSTLGSGALAGPAEPYARSRSVTTAAEDDPRAETGAWSAPFPIPVYAIHAAMLPTGDVMWFGPPFPNFAGNTTGAVLWDPDTGELERVDPPMWLDPGDGQLKPANIYCSGQAFLADGQLLAVGGTLARDPVNGALGLNKIYTFDPWTKTWQEQPDMPAGRWYPTQVLLPDGRQVIMSGSTEHGEHDYSTTIEVFDPPATRGGVGSLTMLEGERGTPGNPPMGALYPHMFAMPSGRTMVAGPWQSDSWYLHTPGPSNQIEWSGFADPSLRRSYSSAALVPPPPGQLGPSTKVMLMGGYSAASSQLSVASTEVYDEAAPQNGWDPAPPMQVGRSYQNTVLLPDGSMVNVGGGVDIHRYDTVPEHQNVELWDPQTGTWRLGAAQAEKRAYHSTAILLPDGRVVSAGDDGNPPPTPEGPLDTAEVYEPPYLFKGPRPEITSAPDEVGYGQTFKIGSPDTDLSRAVLIAPGATTHATDMHQRYVPVRMHETADGASIVAPPDPNHAPPGYYMLFVVDEAGVPSIAEWVRLSEPAPAAGRITIAKQTDPQDAHTPKRSFSFGGDLGELSLSDDESVTVDVVPGTYDVTEAAAAGYELTDLDCDDSDSVEDLAGRRATVDVSPAESVLCRFTNTPGPLHQPPAPPSPPDPPEPDELTLEEATSHGRRAVAGRLGGGGAKARRRVTIACGFVGGRFRCRFALRQRFTYRGVVELWGGADGGVARQRLDFAGACGSLGRRRPWAIKTNNVDCPDARKAIRAWFSRGKPMPRGWSCRLPEAPKTARCKRSKRVYSFKYRTA